MKSYIDIECFCGSTNKLVFVHPSRFKPEIAKRTCPDCGSEVVYRISKLKNGSDVNVQKQLFKASDTLRLMMMEEQNQEKVATE